MKHKRGYRKIRRCLGALLVIAILAEGLGMDIFVSKAAETPEEVSSSSLSAESGTPEKMAEDLFVTSNYVLEEDMVVENLYITGNLDLKGYGFN